jgi:ribosomal protein S18 acetylase RimI-like enzyme
VGESGDVTDLETVLPRAGDAAAALRLRRYARCPAAHSRNGDGWLAVATGAQSNDMNGVVSQAGAAVPDELIDELLAWFTGQGLPASWLVEGDEDDPALAATLVERGARSEDDGWWAGRQIDDELFAALASDGDGDGGGDLADVTITRVLTAADLDEWLGVAQRCGWLVDDRDRRARRRLHLSIGLDDGELVHWLARRDGRAVAMASAHVIGDVVDLCNLAVVDRERRQGIGRALAATRIRSAYEQGATTVVSALSPDGWKLYEPLGFRSVGVTPARWFYLPLP